MIKDNTRNEYAQPEVMTPGKLYLDTVLDPQNPLRSLISPKQTALVVYSESQDQVVTVLLNDDSNGISLPALILQQVNKPTKLVIVRGNKSQSVMANLILQNLQTRLCLWGDNVLDVNLSIEKEDTATIGVKGCKVYVRERGKQVREISFLAIKLTVNEG